MINSSIASDCFSNMALAEYREKSFIEWPFKDGKCTAKQMAKAGFYVTKTDQQAVTCYFCFKELEGWEKNDDPFNEHKKHAPYCEFVNMFEKAPDTITFAQLLKLERARRKRAWVCIDLIIFLLKILILHCFNKLFILFFQELQIDKIYDSTQQIIQKSLSKNTIKRRYKKRK
ncbi:unnamed protein product [Nezara viridula]|uniref:Uncharacterized protein n=1 Tax=Nezara viridula TaxID=85310 RepID=A0A9P0ML78_NEZVI|nr:unnamed protein product [Nezara viridula]